MPRGDKTGPEGLGPMTGRGLGYCAGYSTSGYMHNIPGRGMGRGFGFGRGLGLGLGFRRGRGYGYYPYSFRPAPYSGPTKEEELHILKAQAENLKKDLEEIQKCISELETKNTKNEHPKRSGK
jgi:hypothetical protein